MKATKTLKFVRSMLIDGTEIREGETREIEHDLANWLIRQDSAVWVDSKKVKFCRPAVFHGVHIVKDQTLEIQNEEADRMIREGYAFLA